MIRTALLAVLALVLPACDALDDQRAFRDDAGRLPSGIFRTDDGVTPIGDEDDPDDWRTAPIYAGKFLVLQRAHPNPARADQVVTIVLSVTGFNVIQGGVRLVAFAADGRRQTVLVRSDITSAGTYALTFFPGETVLLGQPGLYRLVLFDGRSEPVTYGDLRVTG